MPTMLPLALEALMRQEGRNVPTEADVGMLGMPTGMPMSNQAPYMQRRAPMDGSLGMLSALISGLSGHAGPMMPPEPDPQTLVMRSFMSPGGNGVFAHGSAMAPQGQEQAASDALQRQFGGQMGTSMDARIAQANAARTGQGMGIADPERHAAWKQGMAEDEAARRGLVNQRAMQEAQSRSYRQMGMHPQLAAILAATGATGDLGQMAAADAVGGRGTGLKMREMDQTNEANNRALDIQEGKTTGAATKPDLRSTAAKVYAEKLESTRGNKAQAAQESLIEVMKTGVTEQEAKTALAEVAGIENSRISPAGTPKKKTPVLGAYGGLTREPGWGDVIGAATDTLGENIRNWNFWKTGMF